MNVQMLFTNVQFPDAMYKCVTYDGQCMVMKVFLIVQAEYSLRSGCSGGQFSVASTRR